jgi:hypothetical protein
MTRNCERCAAAYDDVRRSTICPHEELLPPELMEQKIRACELIGRKVLFAHLPAGAPPALVTTVHWNGMIELEGWTGQFAPHLFLLAD